LSDRNRLIAARHAASPPNELSSPTICGICVIFTAAAISMPSATPGSTASGRIHHACPSAVVVPWCSSRLNHRYVQTTASVMPSTPAALPARAVACWLRPKMHRMKHSALAT